MNSILKSLPNKKWQTSEKELFQIRIWNLFRDPWITAAPTRNRLRTTAALTRNRLRITILDVGGTRRFPQLKTWRAARSSVTSRQFTMSLHQPHQSQLTVLQRGRLLANQTEMEFPSSTLQVHEDPRASWLRHSQWLQKVWPRIWQNKVRFLYRIYFFQVFYYLKILG